MNKLLKDTYIIIPAYNEERSVAKVIKKIKKEGFLNIIVIDDGSTDDTYGMIKKEKVILLRHIINRGKGAAIKTGILAAKLLNASSIITFDADGQHDPKEIIKLSNKLKQKYDIVLGSRLINKKNMPLIRIIANYIGNFFTWLLYGIKVSDSQSGFRAYSKKAFQIIDTKHDRYEFDSEVLRGIKSLDLHYCEVPIKCKYTKYSLHKTTRQSFRNGFVTLFRMVVSP